MLLGHKIICIKTTKKMFLRKVKEYADEDDKGMIEVRTFHLAFFIS